ncbi:MAG TPA: glycosyltransferase family 1 protein [Verrucomicrobiae bacterium]|jgi:glycosyltransferase involved in cell wall biosynthesis|nr:glycosyltransferase family 1 protein [Verrucomicrobiae bacterium]
MLHVGLDAWNLRGDRRGIGRYLSSILRAWSLAATDRVAVTLIVPEWHTWTVAADYRRAAQAMPTRVVSRRWHRHAKLDVLWFPFNGPSWLDFDLPSVATLHDASTFVLPGFDDRARQTFVNASLRCDAILTDSAFSREELIRELALDPQRITSIHLGVWLPDEIAVPLPAGDRFVLFVGETEQRKGLSTLIEAMRIVGHREPGVALVLAGKVRGELPPFLGVDVHVLGHVDDATLERLYRSASVLAYPSTYEGFGLPVLEAMARGLPVVASNAGGIPEAGGDAASYVRPSDPAALAQALLRILQDDAERARCIELGLRRVSHMGWGRTAEETLAIMEAVARG